MAESKHNVPKQRRLLKFNFLTRMLTIKIWNTVNFVSPYV